jgi:hypothetical protein
VPVRRLLALAAALAGGAGAIGVAAAQPPRPAAAPSVATPPAARQRVVIAPLATLGAESSSAEVRAAQKLVARGFTALGSVELVGQPAMLAAVKRARRPELRACDGQPECLASLGQLVGADFAVYGEVGGLGGAQVIYLKLVDARARQELRATVLELGAGAGPAETEARAAATRLLLPGRYVGRVQLDSNVRGASIFVDGRLVARSPSRPLVMAVGSHALRVTHPEFRDFVRFIEVGFDVTSRIPVDLRPYGEVSGDIRRNRRPGRLDPTGPDPGVQPTPWHRRWYAIAGGGALLLVTTAVVVGLASGGLSFDLEKDL